MPGAVSGVSFATQVGHPFDSATISQDVKTLWGLGRFSDIRVETIDRPEGMDVVFHATPEPQYSVHEVQLRPNPFGINLVVPPDAMMTRTSARDLAHTAEQQRSSAVIPRPKSIGALFRCETTGTTSSLTPRPASLPRYAPAATSRWRPPKFLRLGPR